MSPGTRCDAAKADDETASAILGAVARRGEDGTVCPSEVARALAGSRSGDWRGAMPRVHAAARELAKAGRVRLSRRGIALDPDTLSGIYRIGPPPAEG